MKETGLGSVDAGAVLRKSYEEPNDAEVFTGCSNPSIDVSGALAKEFCQCSGYLFVGRDGQGCRIGDSGAGLESAVIFIEKQINLCYFVGRVGDRQTRTECTIVLNSWEYDGDDLRFFFLRWNNLDGTGEFIIGFIGFLYL